MMSFRAGSHHYTAVHSRLAIVILLCASFLCIEQLFSFQNPAAKRPTSSGIGSCLSEDSVVQKNRNLNATLFQCLRRNTADIPSVIAQLWSIWRGREIEFADTIQEALTFTRTDAPKVRCLGLYFPHMTQGGVERVISLQTKLFLQLGYKVVLFTDTLDPKKEYVIPAGVTRVILPGSFVNSRADVFSQKLAAHHVDVLLYHAHVSKNLVFDLLLAKLHGIRVVICRHGSVLHYFNSTDSRTRNYYHIYRLADRVTVLSHMEEAFLKVMGVAVTYLPNPVQFPVANNHYSDNEGIILWVGRLCQTEKNYLSALHIMQLVVQSHPDARLVIIGPESDKDAGQIIQNFIHKNALERNIIWIGEVKNIDDWYKKAKIHLVTSPYEGFPMVIIESKSFGIPLVLYSMPHLELLRDGHGFIAVPRDDIAAAANAINELLDDSALCQKLSEEARQSLTPFKTFDQAKAWKSLLNTITNQLELESTSQDIASLRILLEALLTETDHIRDALYQRSLIG